MVKYSSVTAAAAALLAAATTTVFAHPGEHPFSPEKREESMRRQAFSHMIAHEQKRSLESACGSQPEYLAAREERAKERRLANLPLPVPTLYRRTNAEFARYNAVSHNQTGNSHLDRNTPSKDVFGANTSCVLAPDNADGPYFVWGEQFRSELTENITPGIPLHLELQFIDVETCKPAQAVIVDVWSCNATGAYSGVSMAGEGGLTTTFLRGVQMTDPDGVVDFDTIFPGHYAGRATHEHIIVHVGAQKAENGSYTGGHVAHLSQLFFDQALISQVEATSPYNSNTIVPTTNLADMFTGYAASTAYDPFPEYALLGDDIALGLFMWAELGINTSLNYDAYADPAAYRTAEGNYANQNLLYQQIASIFAPPTHG
ncbi:Intradiol ring-cleavage dioxygenase, core [Niveomyces insectorum RCEF 264]|uniref:Intradiol ring-cleavage dioxygenase, core n=1 Tax=Niveomyces insectorum RCEF 264 TaxID=1081102 RepID=A0A167U5G8_9HYPO|nr:Intradiol ring-cleavage dioxygenase, core [Niveomyces insectorum RCEF 264]